MSMTFSSWLTLAMKCFCNDSLCITDVFSYPNIIHFMKLKYLFNMSIFHIRLWYFYKILSPFTTLKDPHVFSNIGNVHIMSNCCFAYEFVICILMECTWCNYICKLLTERERYQNCTSNFTFQLEVGYRYPHGEFTIRWAFL